MTPEQIEALIRELLKTGEVLATKAFELAIRQVYTYAVMDILAGLPLVILGILGLGKFRGYWKQQHSTEFEDMMVIFSFVSLAIGISLSLMSVRYFINPEWYAVKLLLETFLP